MKTLSSSSSELQQSHSRYAVRGCALSSGGSVTVCPHLLTFAHQLMRIKRSTLLWDPCLKLSASSKGLVGELIFLALAGTDLHGLEKQPRSRASKVSHQASP